MVAPQGRSTWHSLPNEMKLAVLEHLNLDETKALASADVRTYQLCIPVTFKSVKLQSLEQLQRFMEVVPRSYYQHILELDFCTQTEDPQITSSYHVPRSQTDPVISFLLACPRLTTLTLRLAGSLDKSVIAPFSYLRDLRQLTIGNCEDEARHPLSERLVVSIATAVPHLEHLSLDRVSRSKVHAQELEGTYPFVPLVVGDEDIPDHPILGSALSLPSLLTIRSLRKLVIRDTHLGDPRWATTPVACRLEVLDLGSCYHQTDEYNRVCTERIMAAVGRTVDEFSLTTSVSDAVFSQPGVTPLPRLRKLHISPFFPVENVVDTVSNLAGSPIETLSMQCYEDDVVDVCSALEEFLNLRVERGPEFYEKLKRIDVSVAALEDDFDRDAEDDEERIAATKRLQELCRDLKLSSVVAKAACTPTTPINSTLCKDEKPTTPTSSGRANLLL